MLMSSLGIETHWLANLPFWRGLEVLVKSKRILWLLSKHVRRDVCGVRVDHLRWGCVALVAVVVTKGMTTDRLLRFNRDCRLFISQLVCPTFWLSCFRMFLRQ